MGCYASTAMDPAFTWAVTACRPFRRFVDTGVAMSLVHQCHLRATQGRGSRRLLGRTAWPTNRCSVAADQPRIPRNELISRRPLPSDSDTRVWAWSRGWLLVLVVALGIPCGMLAQHDSDPESVYRRAQEAMRVRDYESAAAAWKSLIALMPSMPEARSNLGLAYHLQKKYEPAIEQFQAALRQNPRLLAAKVFLGIDLYLTSRPVKAIGELEGARDLDPGNPLARKWLAMSYVQTGRYTHAIRELKDCRRLDPGDREVVFHLGRVFRMLSTEAFLAVRSAGLESPWYFLLRGQKFTRQGDSRNALEELRHAARIAPEMPGIHYEIASVLDTEGRSREALSAYARELENSPYHLYSAVGLVRALRSLGLDHEADAAQKRAVSLHRGAAEAAAALGAASPRVAADVRLEPRDAERIRDSLPSFEMASERSWQRRALDAILSGQPNRVSALAANGEAAGDSGAAHYWQARAYLAMGQADEALDRLMRLHDQQPSNAEIAFYLQATAEKLALETLELFASLEPGSYRTHQLRAEYYAAAEDVDRAIDEYALALSLAPGATQLHLAIGTLHFGRREYEKALVSFQAELRNDPYSVAALVIMGEVHLALGDTIRAEDALNRAIQINPASGESHKSLGRALFRRRDYRRSVEHLQLALRHGMTDDEDLHYHLGRAQRMVGNLEEAARNLEIVRRLKAARQAIARQRLESSMNVSPEASRSEDSR